MRKLTPVNEEWVATMARILGPQSAAQKALDKADELRDGELYEIGFYLAGSSILVGPRLEPKQ